MLESKRYLGLELAGAKNQKTAVAALELYPKEQKIFLLDIYDKIGAHWETDEAGSGAEHKGSHARLPVTGGDAALLELIDELRPGVARMGVNVALELPPCVLCTRKTCPLPAKCNVPAVKWMRESSRKAHRRERDDASAHKAPRVREFTPYTQRPIELWVRYNILPQLPESHRFEIDETLGGNRAPLTARMGFLQRHLKPIPLAEVWPKLSVSLLAAELGLSRRVVTTYRKLEEGVHSRELILESLVEHHRVFIYERDVRKLAASLTAFDAFICAYTALLADTARCARAPHGFPLAAGWVQYPGISGHPK